jgi:hypothetical protein
VTAPAGLFAYWRISVMPPRVTSVVVGRAARMSMRPAVERGRPLSRNTDQGSSAIASNNSALSAR